jgi:hypothetical protein
MFLLQNSDEYTIEGFPYLKIPSFDDDRYEFDYIDENEINGINKHNFYYEKNFCKKVS